MQRFTGFFMVVSVILAMIGISLLAARSYLPGALLLLFSVGAFIGFWQSRQTD